MSHSKQLAICSAFLCLYLLAGCAPPATEPPTAIPTLTALPATPTALPPSPSPSPLPFTSTPPPIPAEFFLEGTWEGSIAVAGTTIGMNVEFKHLDGAWNATLDIPLQGLFDYPLVEVSFDGRMLHFEGFAEQGGLAKWDGTVQPDGTLSGQFTQMGYVGTFDLAPMVVVATEPPPYTLREVTFQNGEVTLAGTLTLPEGEAPFPALILISGSGAQNRDEEIFGFKIFGIIADHLTRQGIAVLRYDDRGVGGSSSTGEATTADFAGDVLAAIEYLKTLPEVNPAQIGLLGHSEGSEVAFMVAVESNEIAWLISMAGPAMSGEDLINLQVEVLARLSGESEQSITETLALQHQIFDAVLRDGDLDAAKAALRAVTLEQIAALPAAQRSAIGNPEEYADKYVKGQFDAMQSVWYQFFARHNPVVDIEKVRIPVLALFGEKDMQVPPDPNKVLMEEALAHAGNSDASFIVYPDANHLFQKAYTGSPAEYATLPKEFVAGFLDDLARWILKRVQE